MHMMVLKLGRSAPGRLAAAAHIARVAASGLAAMAAAHGVRDGR